MIFEYFWLFVHFVQSNIWRNWTRDNQLKRELRLSCFCQKILTEGFWSMHRRKGLLSLSCDLQDSVSWNSQDLKIKIWLGGSSETIQYGIEKNYLSRAKKLTWDSLQTNFSDPSASTKLSNWNMRRIDSSLEDLQKTTLFAVEFLLSLRLLLQ